MTLGKSNLIMWTTKGLCQYELIENFEVGDHLIYEFIAEASMLQATKDDYSHGINIFMPWDVVVQILDGFQALSSRKNLYLWAINACSAEEVLWEARMHSSRMRTVRCTGRLSCHACPPAMHIPLPHTPYHTCPPPHTTLPSMPPVMHTLGTLALPCTPPTTHSPAMRASPAMHPYPSGQKEWHTLVKTLPFHNYCCGRKNWYP